jgi:hypothetical protein
MTSDCQNLNSNITSTLINIKWPAHNSGYKQKACHNFYSHPDSFIVKPNLSPFTSFVKPALDSFFYRDWFIFRRDLQKLRHGVLPAGIAYRLKNLDR